MLYILDYHFKDNAEKVIQLFVAFGLTGAILCYCIADGMRFLPHYTDKLFYCLSCLMLKPIFLPIILPDKYFRSPVATQRFAGQFVFSTQGIESTTFMLAIQETNFLFSFTMSAFSAAATTLTILLEAKF